MNPSNPSNPNEALILGAVRTPFGRRGGALRETRPDELLATAIGGVLARTGLPGDKVGDVLAGCVSQAGEQGANIARQALLITVLNPKAIVFYMAFFPLFIDPATHRGLPTYAAMALTIAVITAVWCLTLCAFAERIAAKVRAHRRAGLVLQRLAGVCMIGFGLRLLRN